MPKVNGSVRSAEVKTQPETPSARTKSGKTPKPKPPSSAFGPSDSKSPVELTGASAAKRTSSAKGVKVIDNDAYFPELTKLLGGAKKSIDLVQYNFFSESGHGQQVAQQLIQLKKDNPKLKIRLFIEADHGDGAARNQTTMKLLSDAGIDVVPDSKNLITHAKAVCVDGRYVLAGSHNLTNTSMDKNNEVSLSLDSPALATGYEQYFQQLVDDPSHLHPSTVTSGNVTMFTDTAYEEQLLSTIKGAKSTLDASMYDLNFTGSDPKAQEVMDALADAAKRGVKVNLMLEQGTPDFAPDITKANEAAAKWLQDKGVTVHLDSPTQISHQKFIIADSSSVLMGSTNWTKSDFDQRHQVNWLVKDPATAKQLRNILQNEIATEGVPLG
jgi:phosphatidylserine/phosphatidylglycerophosphate/cardiolipin synthase-like enzyme